MSATVFALLAALATFVGALIPVQAATNAAMSRAVNSVPIASLILFVVGLVVVAAYLAVTRTPFPGVEQLARAPVYAYLGGLIVASYVLCITFLAPRLGVGNAICFIVTGQILAAVVIDHFGVFGAVMQAFSFRRGVGVALMIVGLFLAKRA